MKTTFDLPEPLLREVQELAKRQGSTAKSVVEQALRALLAGEAREKRHIMIDRSVGGNGLQPEFANASWEQIRDASYGDRL